VTHAQKTSTRNLHDKFDTSSSQFLAQFNNRAVLECVQQTCTRKNLYKIDRHTCKFLVQDDLHKFLVQVSWACVTSIKMYFLLISWIFRVTQMRTFMSYFSSFCSDSGLLLIVEDILKRRNTTVLTADELTQLKQDISVLLDAASPCQECCSRRNRLLSVKGWHMPFVYISMHFKHSVVVVNLHKFLSHICIHPWMQHTILLMWQFYPSVACRYCGKMAKLIVEIL